MTSIVPNVTLNNGKQMPIFGLGTWNSPKGEIFEAVQYAIDMGYRHFDCAHVYGNEAEIGEAIAAKIAEGVVKREDLFITSKVWNTFHKPELVRGACKNTLKNLQLEYVDLYLIHWPVAFKEGDDLFPAVDGKYQYSDVDYVDTWKAMEQLVDDGLVKSIGLSNFNKEQVERVLAVARITPASNQLESHPYLNQSKLIAFCKSKNISVTAYSPLGSPNRPWAKASEPVLLEDPKIAAIAKKYNKSTAQVLLRYQVERGVPVIPKSGNKERIVSNFNIFDFQLTPEDMAVIDSFDCNGRVVQWIQLVDSPYYPFAAEF